jgi:hypothetical protein|tara:strand:+ start:2492 stop:2836 length:345 start_codon:yes stop_codon:yes gene_type:complete
MNKNRDKKIGVIINSVSKPIKERVLEYNRFCKWLDNSGLKMSDFYLTYTDLSSIQKDLKVLDVVMIENFDRVFQYNRYQLLEKMDEYKFKIYCWGLDEVYSQYSDIPPLFQINT